MTLSEKIDSIAARAQEFLPGVRLGIPANIAAVGEHLGRIRLLLEEGSNATLGEDDR